jgi:hypothetical protein
MGKCVGWGEGGGPQISIRRQRDRGGGGEEEAVPPSGIATLKQWNRLPVAPGVLVDRFNPVICQMEKRRNRAAAKNLKWRDKSGGNEGVGPRDGLTLFGTVCIQK